MENATSCRCVNVALMGVHKHVDAARLHLTQIAIARDGHPIYRKIG